MGVYRRGYGWVVAGLAIVFVAGMLFLYLWLNSQVILLRSRLAQVTLRVQRLREEILSWEYRVSQAFSPERLRRKARELGMAPFDEDHTIYIYLDHEGSSP